MSLETLIAITTPPWKLDEILKKVNLALSACDSVIGLFEVQRLLGANDHDLVRDTILSVDENEVIDDSALVKATSEIQSCIHGFEAWWRVHRYDLNDNGSGIELSTYYLILYFHPHTRKGRAYSSLKEVLFVDAGSQRHFLTTGNLNEHVLHAAKLNLAMLVEELGAIASIPVSRLVGIPVHIISESFHTPLGSAWFYYDGKLYEHGEDVRALDTIAGPVYYSVRGPLGVVKSLQLSGTLD